jgi:predicted transposase YdaD
MIILLLIIVALSEEKVEMSRGDLHPKEAIVKRSVRTVYLQFRRMRATEAVKVVV